MRYYGRKTPDTGPASSRGASGDLGAALGQLRKRESRDNPQLIVAERIMDFVSNAFQLRPARSDDFRFAWSLYEELMKLRELMDKARGGGKTLLLDVMKNNRARLLYERLGFKVIGQSEYKMKMQWKETVQ
jgi:hypothetical protein